MRGFVVVFPVVEPQPDEKQIAADCQAGDAVKPLRWQCFPLAATAVGISTAFAGFLGP